MMKSIRKLFSLEAFKDIVNYRKWIETIKEEEANPSSLYNKYDFSHNLFYVIYMIISLDPSDKELPDNLRKVRVIEKMSPINRYLDEELGFADYLVPEIDEFYDDNNERTLNYGIIYKFAFRRLSLRWFLYRIAFWTATIYSFIKFDLIEKIIGLF